MDTIYEFFRDVANSHSDEPAIIENDRILTFEDLSRMVDRISAGFPGDVRSIGIVMSHRAEMIASILAVLKCGARYIPAEPDFPVGRIRDMMTESQVDFILTESDFLGKLKGFPTRITDDELSGSEALSERREADVDPDDPAYVLYTSGTTGKPKGVCVRNRNVCHYVRAFADEFHPRPGDIMLQYSVCSFDIFVEEVFASLLNGAALAIPSADDKEDIEALMSFVAGHGVTIVSGFPYLLADMNHLPEIPSTLRLLISGGDVLRGVYVDRLLDQATVYNTYGPSETTVCASYYCCNQGYVLDDGTYPVGKPVKGVEIRILDQAGDEVPDGETGEICILGGGVSAGYVGDHEEENRAFVTLPDGNVMYRSGDLGYRLPDGNIAFLHRKDDQIMIYGKRVEVAEVESRLYQCEGVRQAVVRALVDDEGLSYMVAYVVPDEPGLDVAGIKEELAENLTSFMIPECFLEMTSIPMNANGKPDMSKLPVVRRGDDLHGDSDTEGWHRRSRSSRAMADGSAARGVSVCAVLLSRRPGGGKSRLLSAGAAVRGAHCLLRLLKRGSRGMRRIVPVSGDAVAGQPRRAVRLSDEHLLPALPSRSGGGRIHRSLAHRSGERPRHREDLPGDNGFRATALRAGRILRYARHDDPAGSLGAVALANGG